MTSHGSGAIIVGGGAAGCVLARRLGDAGWPVRLLEAGGDHRAAPPPAWRGGWQLPTVPDWGFIAQADPTSHAPRLRRGRLLGGTSWLTRFAVRGHPADFDAWAAQGNPGWSFAEVLPTFRRIERDLEHGADAWHGDSGPIPITRYPTLEVTDIHAAGIEALVDSGLAEVADLNAPDAIGVGRMPMSGRDGLRATAVDAYLGLDRQPPTLTVQPDAPVDRVLVERGRVTGVRLADGTTIPADRVVLAAGTYGSPTILLRSGIGPARDLRRLGIPVAVDLPGVGANLADHPGVDLDSGWRGPGRAAPILHSIATWRSGGATSDGAPDVMTWIFDPDAEDPGFYLDPILLKPAGRGSITLRSADPADPPVIRLPPSTQPRDLDRLAEAYRWCLEVAHHPAIRRLASEPPPSLPAEPAARRRTIVENAYSLPHVVGTCAMGPSAEAGAVVDASGNVHGIEGLQVADASVIPEPPSGFPHLITIMLAEHLADRWLGGPSRPS